MIEFEYTLLIFLHCLRGPNILTLQVMKEFSCTQQGEGARVFCRRVDIARDSHGFKVSYALYG